MNPDASQPDIPLIASPYDLRVSLGEQVGEACLRTAIASGDWGFVHPCFTALAGCLHFAYNARNVRAS